MNKVAYILILFFIIAIPTSNIKASDVNEKHVTVEHAFKAIRDNKQNDADLLIYALAKGATTHAYVAALMNENEKQLQCVMKTPMVWIEFVFDAYIQDRETGKYPFDFVLSSIIQKKCFKK